MTYLTLGEAGSTSSVSFVRCERSLTHQGVVVGGTGEIDRWVDGPMDRRTRQWILLYTSRRRRSVAPVRLLSASSLERSSDAFLSRSIATVAAAGDESLVAPMRSIMTEAGVGRQLNKTAAMTFHTKRL